MLYLLESDAGLAEPSEHENCIIELRYIMRIRLMYDDNRKFYIIVFDMEHDTGWTAFYQTESKARAVLADILDHMKQDTLLANMIKCEDV